MEVDKLLKISKALEWERGSRSFSCEYRGYNIEINNQIQCFTMFEVRDANNNLVIEYSSKNHKAVEDLYWSITADFNEAEEKERKKREDVFIKLLEDV